MMTSLVTFRLQCLIPEPVSWKLARGCPNVHHLRTRAAKREAIGRKQCRERSRTNCVRSTTTQAWVKVRTSDRLNNVQHQQRLHSKRRNGGGRIGDEAGEGGGDNRTYPVTRQMTRHANTLQCRERVTNSNFPVQVPKSDDRAQNKLVIQK